MRQVVVIFLALAWAGCGGADAQLPPTTVGGMKEWLATGQYKSWHCEPRAHPARPPSAHDMNRICQNDLASGHGAGEYPVGAASVKELFDAAGGLRGYSVNRHVAAGTNGGSWYWFESIGDAVDAAGTGDFGVAKASCVACHSLAGTGGYPGHDFVWTQVH
jgi:hypothetical protein